MVDLKERIDEESTSSDLRDPFQRDRDRILYSSAFRRLAGVTQVVNPSEGYIFHNRLTHTIKVAQLGRRLAEKLLKTNKVASEQLNIHPEVVEAAALAHDLGHPPFGHVGEITLNDCMSEYGKNETSGCSEGYNGNAQSFRIVCNLSKRIEAEEGLNLTRATLNAILKYPWFRESSGEKSEKWGVYSTEKKNFDFAREGSEVYKQSTCAFLMDWADDIAYSTHDVEDFYRAGIIPLDKLFNDTNEKEQFLTKQFKPPNKKEAEEALAEILDTLTTPLMKPFTGTADQRGALRFFISTLVGKFVQALTITEKDGIPNLEIDEKWKLKVKVLKNFARYYAFSNPALAAQQFGQKKIIRDTFKILFEIASKPDRGNIPMNKDVLPSSIRHLVKNELENTVIARLVADAIAGMSEQELYSYHRRITGIDPGNILNGIIP